MTIDDPIKALQQQFQHEELFTDSVLRRLADLVVLFPIPTPIDKAAAAFLARIQSDRIEKIELLVETISEQLRRQEERLRSVEINRGPAKVDFDMRWYELVIDGANRAERARSRKRIERIGYILANSLIRESPPEIDDVEEMMRVAVELSDRDVQHLAELVRVEGEQVAKVGRIDRYSAWMAWTQGSWGERIDPGLDSVFSKLESLGLVVRLAPPSNLTIQADFQNRYALLNKGLEFLSFVRQA
jgi:hypothetical protein